VITWLGSAGFLLYNSLMFVFATPANRLFPLYLAMLALAAWSAGALLRQADVAAFGALFSPRTPAARHRAGLCLGRPARRTPGQHVQTPAGQSAHRQRTGGCDAPACLVASRPPRGTACPVGSRCEAQGRFCPSNSGVHPAEGRARQPNTQESSGYTLSRHSERRCGTGG
jgi:hypothetical protein